MKVIKFVGYWIITITQFFAIYTYFNHVLDWNGVLGLIVAVITAGIPIVGTIFGVFGAHYGWDWSWSAALALYLCPYILMGLVIILYTMFDNESV